MKVNLLLASLLHMLHHILILGVEESPSATTTTKRTTESTAIDDKMSCAECTSDCEINSTSYFCFHSSEAEFINLYNTTPPASPHLSKCMPKGVGFNGKIVRACCVWSPDTGCQMVGGLAHQSLPDWPRVCQPCRKTYCPCKNSMSSVLHAEVNVIEFLIRMLCSLIAIYFFK